MLRKQPAQACPSAAEDKRHVVREILAKEPEPPAEAKERFTAVTRKRKARKKPQPKCKCLTPIEYAWDALLSVPVWAAVAAAICLLAPFIITTLCASVEMAVRWGKWLVGG